MLRWLLRRRIDAFEKAFEYDASYMRYILDVSLAAALKFGRIMGVANYRYDIPLDASFAAALTTVYWPRIVVPAANLWSQWASAKASHRRQSRRF